MRGEREALAAQTRQVVGMRAGRAHTGEELKELQGLESVVRRIASAQGYALGESARPTPTPGARVFPRATPRSRLAAVKHATMPAEAKPAESKRAARDSGVSSFSVQ